MPVEFEPVFKRLRAILQKHSTVLSVTDDSPRRYCLGAPASPKMKRPIPVAWTEIGKNYVSYHLMPVYACPQLRDGMSEKLRARMQGKSCFNFKVADEMLFKELEELTVRGFAMFRKAGYIPEKK
ncbi:MAG: hypothetical protein LAO31_02205 [Acidobacteriia bacterium]|nr:hypothetical protein [Terriglobia bacterium]